jgi:tRNA 5-methylaminomethyl-2-thiouridine biosynthesis bifunctional protein
MPYITASASPSHTVYSAGFDFSLRLMTSELKEHIGFYASGALQLPSTKRFAQLLTNTQPLLGSNDIVRLSQHEASDVSGVTVPSAAFFVPSAGYISPSKLVSAFTTAYPNNTIARLSAEATSIKRHGDAWQVTLADGGAVSSRFIVICSAYEANSLNICSWLPLEAIRGQTANVRSSAASSRLQTIISFDGYITPSPEGEHMLGAHYRHNDMSRTVSEDDTDEMVRRVQRSVPALSIERNDVASSRVCFRTSTFDRLPYVGELPDFEAMRAAASAFQPGTNVRERIPMQHYDGLFVSLGHGSRGLLSCPMGGEIIARKICGENLNELAPASSVMSPDRAVFRELGR